MNLKDVEELLESLEARTVELREKAASLLLTGCTGTEFLYTLIKMYIQTGSTMNVELKGLVAMFVHVVFEHYPPHEALEELGLRAAERMDAVEKWTEEELIDHNWGEDE